MANTTSTQHGPIDDLRSALAIATTWETDSAYSPCWAIARLLRSVIEQLGEPSLAATQAACTMLRERNALAGFHADELRHARDVAAAIIRAQVTGEIPPTWSEP